MRKLILRNHQSLGDIVVLTLVLALLHKAYPGQFLTDVLVKGGIVGREIVEAYGGRIVQTPAVTEISTTKLVERMRKEDGHSCPSGPCLLGQQGQSLLDPQNDKSKQKEDGQECSILLVCHLIIGLQTLSCIGDHHDDRISRMRKTQCSSSAHLPGRENRLVTGND